MEEIKDNQPIVDNIPQEGDYLSGKEILEIEKERIKSTDKRTEIARLAIEAEDAADKRMFDYHMARLERETDIRAEQIKLAKHLIYGGSIVSCIVILSLISMVFVGDVHQSEIALDLLETIVKALAGVATYTIVRGIFHKLTKPPTD